ncbi:MAG: tripartite tricarboxylate transporter TctB family protein [Candidatus Heteroscillospira sp.]
MENKTAKGLKIKHANILLGVVSIVLACAIFFICKKDGMQFYMNKAPGPGFMPMISASIIGICGLGITVQSVLRLKLADQEGEKLLAEWHEWRSFFIIIGICSAAVVLADYIGLITAITIAMVLLIRFLGPESWKTSLLVGVGTGIVIYLIFIVLLKVHVPEGPFGF